MLSSMAACRCWSPAGCLVDKARRPGSTGQRPGVILSLLAGVVGAWVLLVEILR